MYYLDYYFFVNNVNVEKRNYKIRGTWKHENERYKLASLETLREKNTCDQLLSFL